VPSLAHRDRGVRTEMKRAGQIDAHDPVPFGSRVSLDRLAVVDADAVHERLQSAELVHDALQRAAGGVTIAQICALGAADARVDVRDVEVDHPDARSRVGEARHERGSDRPRATGHHDMLAGQPQPVRHRAAARDG
jgi:hypothetical protein